MPARSVAHFVIQSYGKVVRRLMEVMKRLAGTAGSNGSGAKSE